MSYQAFGFGMSPVEVPDRCLRCGSGMLDYQLNFIGRDSRLLAWSQYKKASARNAIFVFILAFLTI